MHHNRLRELFAQGNLPEIQSTAHVIKSTAVIVGAVELADSARKLEEMVREHALRNDAGWMPPVHSIEQINARFIAAKEYLKKQTPLAA